MHDDLVIRIENLKYRWQTALPLTLDIEELKVARGETLFIQGPSGCGKSTLLNLAAGVLKPESGSICILNTDLSSLQSTQRDRVRADHIGFIFQLFNLIPYLSVLENVCLPCRFSDRRKSRATSESGSVQQEALRLLSLLEMDSLLKRPVTELSVGQQQRVAAARALMGSPELIIADEPTSALDLNLRDRFVDLLFNEVERTQASMLFVSHDQSIGERFKRSLSLTAINRATQPEASPC
ncbi:ABC transporter ATP-binding protein [Coraliomargarita akajimensis]|uniref:ABC transporter related protein n=1 Tax=Coraliomargarita akajimensis (strain DSM 45221 / IAM 15411 / JCM 23193 / KCTC 12865 / 04OKA010-24) TaxID=583355 RepID=D5EPR6_CORAD|nr:ABC transporter ATP-binding protein [Coraliomargarita akajimensis]ADE55649.1 ABC transporter related protein [Coraliomargarita akajimensis DSM 45221]